MSGGGKRGALELAGAGHRITHSSRVADPRQLTLVAVKLATEQLSRPKHHGPSGGVVIGMAVSRAVAFMLKDEGGSSQSCPSPCGEIEQGSPNTFVGPSAKQVAIVQQYKVSCHKHRDKPIKQGSADVFANNKPVARRTDETCCGALVGEGEPTVWVGAQAQSSLSSSDASSQSTSQHARELGTTSQAKSTLEIGISLGTSLGRKMVQETEIETKQAKTGDRQAKTGEHQAKTTGHQAKTEGHKTKSTGHQAKTAGHTTKTTEHKAKTTERKATTTQHKAKTTERKATTTQHKATTTEHKATTTQHKATTTQHKAKAEVPQAKAEVPQAKSSGGATLTTEVGRQLSQGNSGGATIAVKRSL